jgi:hypothetical protein
MLWTHIPCKHRVLFVISTRLIFHSHRVATMASSMQLPEANADSRASKFEALLSLGSPRLECWSSIPDLAWIYNVVTSRKVVYTLWRHPCFLTGARHHHAIRRRVLHLTLEVFQGRKFLINLALLVSSVVLEGLTQNGPRHVSKFSNLGFHRVFRSLMGKE